MPARASLCRGESDPPGARAAPNSMVGRGALLRPGAWIAIQRDRHPSATEGAAGSTSTLPRIPRPTSYARFPRRPLPTLAAHIAVNVVRFPSCAPALDVIDASPLAHERDAVGDQRERRVNALVCGDLVIQ